MKDIIFYKEWAKEFTMKTWGKELDVEVDLIAKKNGGYGMFYLKGLIVVNVERLLDKPGELTWHEKILDTLKHELCHWYCYNFKDTWKDGSKDFEQELLNVGASSTHDRVGETGREYQIGIVNGTINRQGNKKISYKKLSDPVEDFEVMFCDTDYYTGRNKSRIVKGYEVLYNGETIGIIINVGKRWIARGHNDYVSELYWYTRKQLATEMVNDELAKRGEKLVVV